MEGRKLDMNGLHEGVHCEEGRKILQNISEDEFLERAVGYNIPIKRKRLLFNIIKRQVSCGFYEWVDCSRFALKILVPERVELYNCGGHINSNSEFYEFDPVKNGANIIKHGLGFREVVSYSELFGTLSVPCPNETDGYRTVIFSDLNTGPDGERLNFPLKKVRGTIYTLSVGQNLGGRYRLISARRLSGKSYAQDMKQSFKGIYDDDPEKKAEFVSRCSAIIEQHLLPRRDFKNQ